MSSDLTKCSLNDFAEVDLGLLHIQDGALCDNSERFQVANYYYKVLHLGCCKSPRSTSGLRNTTRGGHRNTALNLGEQSASGAFFNISLTCWMVC